MLNVSLIGFGAIGAGVLELIKNDPLIRVDRVIVPGPSIDRVRATVSSLAPRTRVVSGLDADDAAPDLVVECAGHRAIEEHVLPALQRGIPCMVVSVGALADSGLAERLEAAAKSGKTRVQLLAGAIGAIDALSAAKVGGLDSVVYTGRKSPAAWKDTPADGPFELAALQAPTVIFEGSAREAAQSYPKNANVCATLALAGLGMDHTQVCLMADPSIRENVHHVQAKGAFGEFELTLRGKPLASNPKTSALTVFSVVRALNNRTRAWAI